MRLRVLFAFALCFVGTSSAAPAQQPAVPLRIAVDASRAPLQYFRVRETMPAAPGPFVFVYPHWIPGYHGPVGPIEAVVNLHVRAAGRELAWRRDLVDLYSIATTLPAGAKQLEVDFDVVGASSLNGQIQPISDPHLALIEFSNLVMYPQGAAVEAIPVDARLTLPPNWKLGTALPIARRDADTIAFAPASLYTVVDSPIVTGQYFTSIPLGPSEELDLAADGAAALRVLPSVVTGLKRLVREGPALYGSKHYRVYHFLLTDSDSVSGNGIEHHESSDNRGGSENYVSDAEAFRLFSDLLPHEYSHSWNGKYRRPADLYQPDYQIPERTDLLWVYEGLNQYNGELLSTRSGLNTFADELENLASAAASMDVESGRHWRSLRDTSDAASLLYVSPRAYYDARRSGGDFYTESNLIWLEADVTIRSLTRGSKSLDDFEKLWGSGGSTIPSVSRYSIDDVYALLDQVAHYDWRGFFDRRVAVAQAHAPLGGIEGAGYRLEYAAKPSDLQKSAEGKEHTLDARYSIGASIGDDGTVKDVVTEGVAFKAGLAPGMKIIALDGYAWKSERFHELLQEHKGRAQPLQVIAGYAGDVASLSLDASMGERYPRLARAPGKPDLLKLIYAPHAR